MLCIENPSTSHMQIFASAQPILSKYYRTIWQKKERHTYNTIASMYLNVYNLLDHTSILHRYSTKSEYSVEEILREYLESEEEELRAFTLNEAGVQELHIHIPVVCVTKKKKKHTLTISIGRSTIIIRPLLTVQRSNNSRNCGTLR